MTNRISKKLKQALGVVVERFFVFSVKVTFLAIIMHMLSLTVILFRVDIQYRRDAIAFKLMNYLIWVQEELSLGWFLVY